LFKKSVIVRGIFKELLEKNTYGYGSVERNLEDAPKGEIIALFNKHNIASLVFTKEIDEVFFDSFESAKIIDNIEPNINALELIENIRQRKDKKSLKIMVLAEKPNLYFTSSLLNAGANDYIIKPFSRDEFYVRVYQNIKSILPN